MKHARPDYNRIQDPDGIIPEDEPVFLIRGQDKVGPAAVLDWARWAELAGAKPEIIESAKEQAVAMVHWQEAHGMKTPDLP